MKAHLLVLVGLCAGCSASHAESVEPLAPAEALAEVRLGLERIAAAEDAASARAGWEHAHDAFARGLEGPVRQACGERPATELEYGFALLGAAIAADARPPTTDPGARRERLAAMARALEQSLRCL